MLPAAFTTKQKDVARPRKIKSTDTQEGKSFVKWAACLVGFIVPYASCSNTIHRDNHTRRVRKHSSGQHQWANYRTMQVAHYLWCGLWVVLAVLLREYSLTHYYKKSPALSRIILAIWFWVTVWNETALKIFEKWRRKTSGYSLETAVGRCVNKCSAYQSFSVGLSEPPALFQSMTWTGERKVGRQDRCSHL